MSSSSPGNIRSLEAVPGGPGNIVVNSRQPPDWNIPT